uniref:hypothetical protein n=1 Tax=Aquincola tertiaricarbonis TaxID=391953 RepID=UPI001E41E92A
PAPARARRPARWPRRCHKRTRLPTVRITGIGALVAGERLASALHNLALVPSGGVKGASLIARGHCPVASGPLVLVYDAAEGFVLDAALPFAWTGEAAPQMPSAQGAIAWVCLPRKVCMPDRFEGAVGHAAKPPRQCQQENAEKRLTLAETIADE